MACRRSPIDNQKQEVRPISVETGQTRSGMFATGRLSKLRVGRVSYCCCTKHPTTIVISVRFEYSWYAKGLCAR